MYFDHYYGKVSLKRIYKSFLLVLVTQQLSWPVKYDGLLLGLSIGDLHIADEQAVDGSTILVQVDLHLKRGSRVDIQLSWHELTSLPHPHLQLRLRCPLNHWRCYLYVPDHTSTHKSEYIKIIKQSYKPLYRINYYFKQPRQYASLIWGLNSLRISLDTTPWYFTWDSRRESL